MRIGFDASSLGRYRSGVGHYAESLLRALSTEFPDCEYLVLSNQVHFAPSAENLVSTQKRSFPIKEIWMQFWLPVILARCRPDLCHFTNGVAPLYKKVPYVVTIHDLSLIRNPEWHPWSRRVWMRRLLRPSILDARVIVCDSEATRGDLLSWISLDASKVQVAPLGARAIFRQNCSPARKQAVAARYGLTRPYFFYLGNIEPRKNLAVLLDAFQHMEPGGVDLVLAGRRAWLWRDVIRKIREIRKEKRVHLLDYVVEEDLPALYQSSLAFVYPSRMEGFGLPVLEAMVSGTAVIVSRIEPLVSLVGNAGWLVDVSDVEQWRAALAEAARHEEKRRTLALLAKERAAPYTWERSARATMRCYEEALS